MKIVRTPCPVSALAAVVLAAAAPPLEAQERPASMGGSGGPRAVAEARLGWDYQSEAPALGAALRFPLFGARGDIVAGGEAVFRDGLTEAQGHLDAVVALGGRSNALVAGGGPVMLSSIFEQDGERETRWGYSLLAGLRQLPADGPGLTLELRWIFVDDLEPAFLTLGVGLPLFRMPF